MGIALVLRDFQGRWEGWEAWVWLSMLSTDRHFHGLLVCCCFSSLLLSFESPPEAVGLSSGLEDVRSIRDSVQQRLAEARVRNYLRPLGERQVRCEDDGGSLCAFSNHLEEKLGTHFGEWNIANLVDCDQIVPAPPGHHAPQLKLVLGLNQFIYQRRSSREANAPLLPACGNT